MGFSFPITQSVNSANCTLVVDIGIPREILVLLFAFSSKRLQLPDLKKCKEVNNCKMSEKSHYFQKILVSLSHVFSRKLVFLHFTFIQIGISKIG